MKDILLKEVDRFSSKIDEYDNYCEASVIYSIYLLAEFRDTRLYDRIINLLNCKNLDSRKIIWEGLSDSYDNILVSLFNGDFESLNKK